MESTVKMNSVLDPAKVALLVQTASKFKSRIMLVHQDRRADAKSIMGVISLGLNEGQSVTVTVDGEDEGDALPVVKDFLQAN